MLANQPSMAAGRLGRADGDQQLADVPFDERRAPREAAVRDGRQGIEIAAPIDGAAQGLFRAHVQRCAHNLARVRLMDGVVGADCFGHAEIEQLDEEALLVGDQEQVFGFDVAMDDVDGVGLGESTAGLRDEGHRFWDVEPVRSSQAPPEIFPLQQLHDDEAPPLLREAIVENVDHVRAVDARDRRGLSREPGADIVRAGPARLEKLDGHFSIERQVVRLPNAGHSAATQQPLESKSTGNNRAGYQRFVHHPRSV
jgi:hypothetical protein